MKTRVNSEIKANRVLLIGDNGDKIGIFMFKDALNKAKDSGLDLMQVSADQQIPVCKIVDYGRLQYEQKKKKKLQQQNVKKIVVKEIRLRPSTDKNDVDIRIKQANKFLSKGNHVRFNMKLKGRDNAHRDLVLEKLQGIVERLEGRIENQPSFSGNLCTALIVPE